MPLLIKDSHQSALNEYVKGVYHATKVSVLDRRRRCYHQHCGTVHLFQQRDCHTKYNSIVNIIIEAAEKGCENKGFSAAFFDFISRIYAILHFSIVDHARLLSFQTLACNTFQALQIEHSCA